MMGAIRARHSVRKYTDEPIPQDIAEQLNAAIDECNAQGGLHFRLATNEPQAFDSALAHYGSFSGVRNYFVLAGPDAPELEERCGYYGEKLVLLAQQLGLNTCWVALTFKKRFVKKTIAPGDKLVIVISLGYGVTQGKPRKSKPASAVSSLPAGMDAPDWFSAGIDAALLAPTAMNQQSFEFSYTGKERSDGEPVVSLRSKGGAYADVDLGIARLHFELGVAAAGHDVAWEGTWQK